jgi:CRISPR-associated exonuclease Cas4
VLSTVLFFALLLFLISLVLFWQARRSRQAAGLPGGRLIYTDMRGWLAVEKPLYDSDLGLTGKPDYLVEKNGRIIPVEVKTSRRAHTPYDSHIYQLAAYCLLVQRTLGKRPPYGILHYSDGRGSGRTYTILYTPQLESAVLGLIAKMRAFEHRKEIQRSHNVSARCARCGFRSICEQRMR